MYSESEALAQKFIGLFQDHEGVVVGEKFKEVVVLGKKGEAMVLSNQRVFLLPLFNGKSLEFR